jgi:integrase
VAALAVPSDGQTLYWDANEGKHMSALEGFGVRITANGKRAYVVQARVAGKTRRVVIGACNLLALEEARKRAQKTLTAMRVDGVDVTATRRAQRLVNETASAETAAKALTLRSVMEQYLRERRVADRPLKDSTKRDVRRHVEVNFSDWADEPVANIGREAVKTRFTKLSERAPQQAKQAMGVLRSLLTFARDENAIGDEYPILAVNPVTVALRRQLKPADGRQRMVPVDKVRAVWQMLFGRRSEDPDVFGAARTGLDIVAFGLLTGCRLGEAQNLTFDLINLKEGWWRITAETAKDSRARTLPLSPAAVELLQAREVRGKNPFVFPSRTVAGRQHFKDPRGAMKLVSEVAGLHLSYHDLRRTFVAVAIECRIEKWRYELLTSHKLTDVTGRHYTQTLDVRYLRDDAEQIDRWITATTP